MTRTLDNLIDRPDIKRVPEATLSRSDSLSHLLAWVRLKGDTVYRAELHDPWRLRFPPGPPHVHLVTEGTFNLTMRDGSVIRLEAGDLALLPHGHGHEIASETGAGVDPVDAFHSDVFDGSRLLLANRGIAQVTRMVGGLFQYERAPLPPVVKALPMVIHLRAASETARDWRSAMALFLVDEVDHPAPGSALMISRIIDLMVIRTLRSWADEQPKEVAWLGGVREERLGRALSAMHEEPSLAWSVKELAGIAGMSRSVFSARFARAFGEPPLRYLTRWRFALAVDLLSHGELPLSEIAHVVGYESEAGFSRAFKAFHGQAPSSLRHGRPGTLESRNEKTTRLP